jgi:hypothetical protein
VSAQLDPDPLAAGGVGTSITQFENVTLTFESREARLTADAANSLVNEFGSAMSAECAYFSAKCPRTVIMSVVAEAEFKCGSPEVIAACAFRDESDPNVSRIVLNGKYLTTTPAYDVVAHETMHLVQGHLPPLPCDYWTEGEADLARFWWGGVPSEVSGFSLPAPPPPGSGLELITDQGTAAAFLLWIHENWKDEAILAFHASLLSLTCPETAFWKATTGFDTFDALWNGYLTGNPVPPQQPVDSDG